MTALAETARPGLNPGRVAGLIYLLLVLAAPYRLLYIPSTLIVRGDAPQTARNILEHEGMFRFGMVTDLFCGVVIIYLTLALYRLFAPVNRRLAVLMVIVGGILPALVDFVLVVHDAAALTLIKSPEFLNTFTQAQRESLAMLFLRMHDHQVYAAETLWGLWLFPLAILTYRSGFLPRFLGVWLVVNGVAYLVMSLSGLLAPQYRSAVADAAFPALLGELAFMLWLVVRGVNFERWRERAASGMPDCSVLRSSTLP